MPAAPAPQRPSLPALWGDTLRALAVPRRAVPIAFVAGSLILAQWWFSRDLFSTGIAAAEALLFLLLCPFAWRALHPLGRGTTPPRLFAFLALAALPAGIAWVEANALGLGDSFLTIGVNTLVIAALSAAGGWGLARDVEQEASLQRALAEAREARRQAEAAELLALRAHLDPHFLFNTLNAIAEWTREDPEVAESAILQLSGVLREVMAGVRAPAWPLSRELEVARAVWELHTVRDPERFAFDWRVPDPAPVVDVPPLVLLPVVENAVKHGPAAGHRGRLVLVVEGGEGEEEVRIVVDNPGAFGGPRDGGEGLALVRRRLSLALGDRATFTIGTRPGGDDAPATRAILRLPRSRP